MPTYEYQCTACGHQMESFQKITDLPLTDCPVCHQSKLQKILSAAAFQLKGTGWYVTDFRDKDKPPQPKSSEKIQEEGGGKAGEGTGEATGQKGDANKTESPNSNSNSQSSSSQSTTE